MKDENKTKKQLMNELKELRKQITGLEASETECKRAEEELGESEAYLKTIFETSQDGFAVIMPLTFIALP